MLPWNQGGFHDAAAKPAGWIFTSFLLRYMVYPFDEGLADTASITGRKCAAAAIGRLLAGAAVVGPGAL